MIELSWPYIDLARLDPMEVKVGYGSFGRLGNLGYEDKRVEVGGRRYLRALSTHPPARVTYAVSRDRWRFDCSVALNDDSPSGISYADFAVLAAGQVVAAAHHVLAGGRAIPLEAEFEGADRIELVVSSARPDYAHAVWLEPRLRRPPPRQPATLRDPLDRVEIEVPDPRPRSRRCVVTCASKGYAQLLDNFLGSVMAEGGCQDALLAVFAVDSDPEVVRVAKAYGAAVIPCRSRHPVNPWVKSVLYSAARVIDAEVFLCCDVDLLVLGDISAIFAAVDACPPGTILCCLDSNFHNHETLDEALRSNYRGSSSDIDRLLGRSFGEASSELVVNDGLFCGNRSAILSIDATLRSMRGAAGWLNGYFLRNQFLFNLALVRSDCGVLLDDIYNLQLHWQNPAINVIDGHVRAEWRGREVRVLHFSGGGRRRYAESQNVFARQVV